MRLKNAMFAAALASATALSIPASAAVVASAVTPLNIRSGPGPQFAVIGAIPGHGQATIIGCIQGSLWCQVNFNGKQGWAYSQYLMATLSGRSLAVAEIRDIPPVQAPVEVVGSAVPAPVIAGQLVAPPVAAAPLALTPPPPTVQEYVVSHPIAPVYLNGEVVEGAGLPDTVAVAPVPGTSYDYAYVNSVPVLVEPNTRQVVYVYR
jgi:uncharacterized protein YraI